MFKNMLGQKRKEQLKAYEKQEKRLKELKSSGQSKKIAEKKQKEVLTRKQEKNKTKIQKQNNDDNGPQELLARPREYIVKFNFPDPPPLQPPILGLHSAYFLLINHLLSVLSTVESESNGKINRFQTSPLDMRAKSHFWSTLILASIWARASPS